ncbi:hypothetical protein DFH08DRAFT_826440 [Mycena albidolilacea]|uniref:Uncharacterized protein n=1 Tax=Mycena albidolilacea TaxID=1033008 RepID=A0AAD7E889_9AGAR|nr:hypothetical protein DFH08DRAFT_826440 [Mycena albidolilacea]
MFLPATCYVHTQFMWPGARMPGVFDASTHAIALPSYPEKFEQHRAMGAPQHGGVVCLTPKEKCFKVVVWPGFFRLFHRVLDDRDHLFSPNFFSGKFARNYAVLSPRNHKPASDIGMESASSARVEITSQHTFVEFREFTGLYTLCLKHGYVPAARALNIVASPHTSTLPLPLVLPPARIRVKPPAPVPTTSNYALPSSVCRRAKRLENGAQYTSTISGNALARCSRNGPRDSQRSSSPTGPSGGDGGEKTAGHAVAEPASAPCSVNSFFGSVNRCPRIPDTTLHYPLASETIENVLNMPTIRAAALEREIDDLLTNRKRYLERAGWTYLLERQGPKGRVEVKIGKADDVHKRLGAYTKCSGIRAVPCRVPHPSEIAQAGRMARTSSLSRALSVQSPRMVPAFEGRRIEEGEAVGGAVFGVRGQVGEMCAAGLQMLNVILHDFAGLPVYM